jgi:1-acyl-sn-glycerol-3-phosphate acyltransferase
MTQPQVHTNQFALLTQRRFAPFFWTQFLGAGNDNLFKFAFTMLVTYQVQVPWLPNEFAGLVIAAVFITPFLLFSATSGQLADKIDKAVLIRWVKWLEVVVMLVAAWGFTQRNMALLLVCVFLMGLHSTLFGPVKFAYLPQHLSERELTGGNGMVEMGTFVAILLGNVAGGLLIALPVVGVTYVAWACLAVAVLGRVTAQAVPCSPPADPQLKINWNPISETWRNLQLAAGNVVVYRSLLGISWLWFFGAVFLSQFPAFAKGVLHGDEQVASLLLVVFSVGIGVGSLLCEVLSRRQVEVGLVPLGVIGMGIFSIDLYFASCSLPPHSVYTVASFLAQSLHWRVMADLALLALFAGLYSVPMYALIQMRSEPSHRARTIAANNILNALFMIVSSLTVGLALQFGASIAQIFLGVGLLNMLVAVYIFFLLPEYFLRFVAFLLTRCIYRFRLHGEHHIPTQGAAILVSNHVSFIDAVLLMGASPRPVVFIMDHRIFKTPVLGWMFKLLRAIPIAPQRENPAIYAAAFAQAAAALDSGQLVCIFPEGSITQTGQLGEFKRGVMRLLERNPVPVIPMALHNLWGSFFSRIENGVAMVKPFRRGLWNRVELRVGEAIAPGDVSPQFLHHKVRQLLLGLTQKSEAVVPR